MAQDAGAQATPSPVRTPPLTAAERMRRHRARRRNGWRYVTAVLREGQIETLIHRGWLPRAERSDPAAVQKALTGYLSDVLGDAQRWPRR